MLSYHARLPGVEGQLSTIEYVIRPLLARRGKLLG
jgi:hypothetical protein